MKHRYFVIIGNVGVGKSTLSYALSEHLKAELVPADELFTTNPFFNLAVEDRKRWSLTSDIWFLLEREKIINNIKLTQKKKDIIVDSGLAMSWVYANTRLASGHFNSEEWELYQELFMQHGKPTPNTIYIYITAPIETLLKNIAQRKREHEIKHYTSLYLESMRASLDQFIANTPKKIININTAETKTTDEQIESFSTQIGDM